MKLVYKNSIIIALCIMLILAFSSLSINVNAELVNGRDPNALGPNSMEEPTEEELERAREKIEKGNAYVALKEAGRYEEALVKLKEMFPHSKTTIADIRESAITGENMIPQENLKPALEPMETEPVPAPLMGTRALQNEVWVQHYPQQKATYCAPAAVRSIISNQSSYPPSQLTLANKDHLNTEALGQTPFNAALSTVLNLYMHTPLGDYELAWGSIFTEATLKNALKSTIDAGYPFLANGVSGGPESYITFSFYPVGTYHYVCVWGYGENGNRTNVCDPVANTSIPGFSEVIPYYSYLTSNFYAFIRPRGIVY